MMKGRLSTTGPFLFSARTRSRSADLGILTTRATRAPAFILTKRTPRAAGDVFWPPGGFTFLCHPDDLSNARGGRTSDSFADAKPVPFSENRRALLCIDKRAKIQERQNKDDGINSVLLSELCDCLAA